MRAPEAIFLIVAIFVFMRSERQEFLAASGLLRAFLERNELCNTSWSKIIAPRSTAYGACVCVCAVFIYVPMKINQTHQWQLLRAAINYRIPRLILRMKIGRIDFSLTFSVGVY